MPASPYRRRFVAASVAVGSLVITGTRTSRAVAGANDRVRIAMLGCNGRGQSHLDGFGSLPGVEIAAVCDPDQKVLDRTFATLAKKAGDQPLATKGEQDFRRLLDDTSIDAISIATPNHWHSLMTILAAQAGKHVYVEKPLSHDVVEGRVAVEAQKKYGVVVQHGTQRRSSGGIAGLHEALKNGTLPKLKIAYGYCCKPRAGIGTKSDGDPPASLDWDLWKGPAVLDHYNANLVHYNWHWFWKTGNGDLNNRGTHQLDVARWAIDDDQTHPVRAVALGGRFGDRTDVAEHFGKLHAIMRDGVGLPADGRTYRVGPMLSFDPATERHTGDHAEAANALLKDPNTKGFEVPDAARV